MRAQLPFDRVYALLDWNNLMNQLELAAARKPISQVILRALLQTQDILAATLSSIRGDRRYRCTIRVYDGWHKKFEPSQSRRNFEKVHSDQIMSMSLSRTIGRVAFPGPIEIADSLLGDDRYGTLYDTVRAQGQKMVDTAIVADALYVVSSNTNSVAVIVSNDDDMFPALVSAEARGESVYVLRRNPSPVTNIIGKKSCPKVLFW